MHLAFQIRLVFCFCGGFFAVRNAVGGILDSSHVFKGMGFVKLLKKKNLHYRIFTNIHGNDFFL